MKKHPKAVMAWGVTRDNHLIQMVWPTYIQAVCGFQAAPNEMFVRVRIEVVKPKAKMARRKR